MNYELPKSVIIGEIEYEIRSDYRAILDICTALSDPELNGREKAYVTLDIFYPAFSEIPQELIQEALEKCFDFIEMGNRSKRTGPTLMNWEQDFQYIIAPINRAAGTEIRALPYMHWWTFLAYYQEIGDCLFAQIVAIRDKRARGKPLDKQEREWYRRNRDIVDLKTKMTQREAEMLAELGIK